MILEQDPVLREGPFRLRGAYPIASVLGRQAHPEGWKQLLVAATERPDHLQSTAPLMIPPKRARQTENGLPQLFRLAARKGRVGPAFYARGSDQGPVLFEQGFW